MQLEALATLDDNPDLVRAECFYVGWQLRSPNSWDYRDLFSYDEGTVTLTALIIKVKEKRETIRTGEIKDIERIEAYNFAKRA